MAKPDRVIYLAKVFNRKDGDTTRSVVSFDKGTKNEDGSWTNSPPDFIQYKDGSQVHFGSGPFTFKLLDEPRGQHYANVYQSVWPDDKKKDEPFDEKGGGDDEPIPF